MIKTISGFLVGILAGALLMRGHLEPLPVAPNAPSERNTDMYSYNATVLRVVDGDTVRVSVDLGFRIKRDIVLRLKDIDAPEMDTDDGKEVKQILEDMLPVGSFVRVQTYRDADVYDRYTAIILVPETGGRPYSVNEWLVNAGYVKRSPYQR